MTAKKNRREFVKIYLKPALKSWAYKTTGHNWWKDRGDFYTVIHLQNFSWNTENNITFCFNTGVVLKETLAENGHQYPHIQDFTVCLSSDFYLPENRKEHIYKNTIGYLLTDDVDLSAFIDEVKLDFETYILPSLEKITTLKDCTDQFGEIPFLGENFQKAIKENNLL